MGKLFNVSHKSRKRLKWLWENKTWVFSGIGTSMVAIMVSYYVFSSRPQNQGIEADCGSIAAGRDITATASESGTAVIQSGTGTVYVGIPVGEYRQLAEEYARTNAEKQELSRKLEEFSSPDPAVVKLKHEAKEALDSGHFDRAEQLLNEALQKDIEAANKIKKSEDERLVSAARTKSEIGELKSAQLHCSDAAICFSEAAGLLPDGYDAMRAAYLNAYGDVPRVISKSFSVISITAPKIP